ncbi:hypothetical protein J8J27_22000, partial [Mycobacterium tuberculosis]|nr:hypothetical protein [Mycobacterium tuberculosis]
LQDEAAKDYALRLVVSDLDAPGNDDLLLQTTSADLEHAGRPVAPAELRARLAALAVTTLATPLAATAQTAAPGAFAAEHYTTRLAGICPSPFVVQKDWLIQSEHGAFYQLIGAGGKMSQGRYEGPLGATGIDLVILEGGPGLGLGDGETPYSALYA